MLCGKKDTSLQDKTQKPYKAAPDAAALTAVIGAGLQEETMALGLCEPPPALTTGREPQRREIQESLFRVCYKQEKPTPHLHSP